MEGKKVRVGLYGIGGVYNLGCEAIVRGTYFLNKKIHVEIEWIYFSSNAIADAEKLSDLPIKVVQPKKRFVFPKRIVNKMFDILNIDRQIPYDDYKDILNHCDTIISIGGDIYTIPNYLRNKKKYSYHNRMVEFGELAIKMKKKMIVYGASIGPFGNYNKAINYYKNHLSKVDGIFIREICTKNYLEEIGIKNNVYFLPDPAFSLRGMIDEYANYEKKIIGLNLSGLSILETYGEVTESSIKKLANVVMRIIDNTNYDMLFIPHVFSKYDVDNDYVIMNRIFSVLPNDYQKRILISQANCFLDVKEKLVKCDMVIAARMHCAINAMSEGVPTILLSYSSKAKGMSEFCYDNEKWVFNIKDIERKNFLDLIRNMITDRKEISINLNEILNKKLADDLNCDSYKVFSSILNNHRGENNE